MNKQKIIFYSIIYQTIFAVISVILILRTGQVIPIVYLYSAFCVGNVFLLTISGPNVYADKRTFIRASYWSIIAGFIWPITLFAMMINWLEQD